MDRFKFKFQVLGVAMAMAVILLTAGAAFAQSPTPAPTPEPAITVLAVELKPERPARGGIVTVTATVVNYGTSPVQQALEAMADDVVVGSLHVALEPGEQKAIRFTFEAPDFGFSSITVGEVTELVSFAVPEEVKGPSEGMGTTRVGPSVRLNAVRNVINSDQDAKVDLYYANSELNDLPIRIEVAVDIPAGLFLYSQDSSMACAAGRCLGVFTAAPGTVRNMPIIVKSDRPGDYFVRLNSRFWPEGQPDRWAPVALSIPIRAVQSSPDPSLAVPTDPRDAPGWTQPAGSSRPWFLTPAAILGYAVLAIVVIATAGYAAIAGSVRAARHEGRP